MALLKNIETDAGIVIKYFRIFSFTHYCVENKLDVNIQGYISEEARRANKMPATSISFQIDIDIENPTRQDIYEKIKQIEFFDNALDT